MTQSVNSLLAVSQTTKTTYTYNNIFILPVVIEVENDQWTCQFGHRLFSGDGTEALVILREIMTRLQSELTDALTALDTYKP